jgi:phage tail-like protein
MQSVPYFGNFNFLVEIEDLAAGGSSVVGGFSLVSGISTQSEVVEHRVGNSNTVMKIPGKTRYGNIVLQKGCTTSSELYQWRRRIENGEDYRRSGSIVLLDGGMREKGRAGTSTRRGRAGMKRRSSTPRQCSVDRDARAVGRARRENGVGGHGRDREPAMREFESTTATLTDRGRSIARAAFAPRRRGTSFVRCVTFGSTSGPSVTSTWCCAAAWPGWERWSASILE